MPVVTNWGEAIFTALANALNLVLTFIPKFLGFLVILLVGWILASIVSKAVTVLLRKIGFDRWSTRMGLTRVEQQMGVRMDPAGVVGKLVYWFLFLIFLVPATDALGLTTVSAILNRLVDYLPNVVVAILVLFLGTLAATFVANLVRAATAARHAGSPTVVAEVPGGLSSASRLWWPLSSCRSRRPCSTCCSRRSSEPWPWPSVWAAATPHNAGSSGERAS